MLNKCASYLSKIPGVVVSLILCMALIGSTADFFSMGYVVQGTPFDAGIRSAGGFNLTPAPIPPYQQESIENLFFTARSFRYSYKGVTSKWQSSEETEARHAGDCKDKAIWLFTRLIQNGYYNVRLVVGRYRSVDNQLHAWVICSDKHGNTCLLDPTKQKRIWYQIAVDSGFYHPLYAYDGQNRYRYFRSP